MDNEVNSGAAAPFTTAGDVGSPDISSGLSGPSNDAGNNVGGYYGFGSNVWNWLTGANTARERQTEAANQAAMAHYNAQFNANEAAKARAYDEYMSNTAISRAVRDAERNGINKYYLLNSGLTASTPSGPAASSSASYEPLNASGRRGSGGKVMASLIGAIGKIIAAALIAA